MMMPARLAPQSHGASPAIEPTFQPTIQINSRRSSGGGRREDRFGLHHFLVMCLGFLAIFLVAEFVLVNQKTTPYDRGFAAGELWGELMRNEGRPYSPSYAKELLLADIELTGGNTSDRQVANDPRYKKSTDIPRRGTPEYGEYMRGFDKGYHKGYR
jgi:hypothetical protein